MSLVIITVTLLNTYAECCWPLENAVVSPVVSHRGIGAWNFEKAVESRQEELLVRSFGGRGVLPSLDDGRDRHEQEARRCDHDEGFPISQWCP
jgi:hypothetical protein